MDKKYVVLIGILVLVIIVGGIGFVMRTNKSSSATSTQSDGQTQLTLKFSGLQAHYPSNPETCLATSNDPGLKPDGTDQTDIENAVASTVIDIPAGTNIDVHIKSYDKTSATGTSIYESTYGSYNFTAKKPNQGSWVVTKFVACKK